MTDTTFPTTGDSLTQAALLRAFKRTAGARDHVPGSGNELLVSAASGLAVDVAAGEFFVNGKYGYRDVVTNLTGLASNSTLYVYASYTGSANGISITSTSTAPDSGDSWSANPERVLLAVVVTGPSSVTSVTDRRNRVAVSGWGAA